jgi:hypothetical protein
MRGDQTNATARIIVGETIPLMTKGSEHRDAEYGFVENDAHEIDEALRLFRARGDCPPRRTISKPVVTPNSCKTLEQYRVDMFVAVRMARDSVES